MPCDVIKTRDISELSTDPLRPLTQDQVDHIGEYLTLKNHDKSARDVSIAESTEHVLANLDYYLGIPGAKEPNVVY